jgi:hypothetical protein
VPVLVFSAPPLAFAGLGFSLFRSAVLRGGGLAVALTCVGFAYYGYLGEDIWRLFSWRWTAVTASVSALVSAFLLAPSLLGSALRLSKGSLAAALAAAFASIYLLSTEVTGTDPRLWANLSPWPILTLIGFLLLGYGIGALHLAAGAGGWVWSRLHGMLAPLAGLLVASVAGGMAGGMLFSGSVRAAVVAGIAAAAYALIGAARGDPSGFAREGLIRATAGGLLIGSIFVANWGAETYQAEARDETSPLVIAALEAYRVERGSYPDRLEDLVPEFLSAVPEPRMGLIAQDDEKFVYTSFGDSYALEFSAALWVQCAYSPPYDDSFDDLEGTEDETGALPDVAAGGADEEFDSLDPSWSCESTPPRLF